MTNAITRTVHLRADQSDLPVTIAEVGSGRTALVLHGGGGPATVASIATHLSPTMHVITPTHPGWNGTERPAWLTSVADLARAYLQLLQDEGLRDVVVVGSSLGGWIACEMALRDEGSRIAGLVLIDTGGVEIAGQPIRNFFALDAKTGKPLWDFQTGGAIAANPISFNIDGKQCVAIASGRVLYVFSQ